MHLLKAQTATPEDAGEAIDLGQTPGDIVLLSAADTELACLAAAQARRPLDAPSLRLANLLQLGHPMSVDLYVDRVVARARLVILRLLGGRSYWAYGLEQTAAICRAGGIHLATLPGDEQAKAISSTVITLTTKLVERGVPIVFVHSAGGAGAEFMDSVAEELGSAPLESGLVRFERLPNSDRLYTLLASQEALMKLVCAAVKSMPMTGT